MAHHLRVQSITVWASRQPGHETANWSPCKHSQECAEWDGWVARGLRAGPQPDSSVLFSLEARRRRIVLPTV